MSRYLYRMNSHTQTPVVCVWAVTVMGILLGLIAFAGPTAINAIFNLSIFGSYTAYAIPVLSRLLGGEEWHPGPFNLRRLVRLPYFRPSQPSTQLRVQQSVPIAVTAATWNVFAIIIVMFPGDPDPDSTSMNYTVAVGGGWIALSVVYYFFPKYGGRYWFQGPLANIDRDEAVEVMEQKIRSSDEDEKKGT